MCPSPEGPPRGWAARLAGFGAALGSAPLCFLSAALFGAGIGWQRGEREPLSLALAAGAPGLAFLGLVVLGFAWPAALGVEDERAPTWATTPVVFTSLVVLAQGIVDGGGFAVVRPLELGRSDHVWREPWAVAAVLGIQVSLSLAMRRRGSA